MGSCRRRRLGTGAPLELGGEVLPGEAEEARGRTLSRTRSLPSYSTSTAVGCRAPCARPAPCTADKIARTCRAMSCTPQSRSHPVASRRPGRSGSDRSSDMAPLNCNTRPQGRRSKDTHPRCPSLLFVEAAKA